MSNLKPPGHKIIKCPYCGYEIDLAVSTPTQNCAGELFVSCPNPTTFSSFSIRNKPCCGQYIPLDENYDVVKKD